MKTMKKFAVAFVVVVSVLASAAFAATDVSAMKRSEIIALLFVKGTTAEVNDGFGVTGKLQNGLDVTLGGVLVSMQTSAGGNYATGDVLKVTGTDTTATAWFSSNKDEEPETKPEIVEIAAKDLATAADLTKHFTVKSTGTYGEIVAEIPANVKFTVYKTWTAVSTTKGNLAAGDSYTTGSDAEVTTWWPAAEDDGKKSDPKPEEAPKITEIPAEKLVSAEDLARYFKTSQGKDGEIVAMAPAYTRFTVPESWAAVSTAKGNILAKDTYQTGGSEERTSWWVNPEYWEKVNSVEITTDNLAEYLQESGDLREGSLWKVYAVTEKGAEKTFTVAENADFILLARKDGKVVVSEATDKDADEIIIAKKADISNKTGEMFASASSVEAADPNCGKATAEKGGNGSMEYEWFCASDELVLTGSNLKKVVWWEKSGRYILKDKDGNVVQNPAEGKYDHHVLSTNDGGSIGTLSVYLYKETTSGNGAESNTTSGGGSGGGGCNGGFGVLALLLLPIFFQKGKKSN